MVKFFVLNSVAISLLFFGIHNATAQDIAAFLLDTKTNARLGELKEQTIASNLPILAKLPKKVSVVADISSKIKADFVFFKLYRHINGKLKILKGTLESFAPYSLFANDKNKYNGKTLVNGTYGLYVQAFVGTKKNHRIVSERKFIFHVGKDPIGTWPEKAWGVRQVQPPVTPAPPLPVPPTPIPVVPTVTPTPYIPPISGGNTIRGVTFSPGDIANKSIVGQVFQSHGIESTRSWFTIHWKQPPTYHDFDMLRSLRQQGIETMVVFTPPEDGTRTADDMLPSDPSARDDLVRNYFTAAMNAGSDAIDYWEIINEANLPKYWYQGDLQLYLKVLSVASNVLRGKHHIVVGTGISEKTTDFDFLVDHGMLDLVDAVAFHPYANSVEEHVRRTKAVSGKLANRKALYITEWNIKSQGDDWGKNLIDAYGQLQNIVDGFWYYRATEGSSNTGAAGYLFNEDGSDRTMHFHSQTVIHALNCAVRRIYKGQAGFPASCGLQGF